MKYPYPAEYARTLERVLPKEQYTSFGPRVKVVPRDAADLRVPAYAADHYEVVAFYAYTGEPLDALRDALMAQPGAYMCLVYAGSIVEAIDGWPINYRDMANWRPQVRVLIRLDGM